MNTVLVSILALVMSWTVETKSTIEGSGNVPANVQATYSCTYQKGTVRAGDTARLVLTGMNGLTVERIDVHMRSNKSAGAGVLSAYGGKLVLAQTAGSLKDWVGQYDNAAFHPFELYAGSQTMQDSLVIELVGTTNSLYIEKFVITYQSAPVYTITLMNGEQVHDEQTEAQGGDGIVLPALPDREEWLFAGWSPMPFWTMTTLPEIYVAESRLFIEENTTLWAVWRYSEAQTAYQTDLQTGEYLYLNTENKAAITGTAYNGVMDFKTANINDAEQVYHITFNTACDTATIQHVATGSYIGHRATALVNEPTPWLVWHEGDKTAFYTHYNGDMYILWPNIVKGEEEYAGLFRATSLNTTPTAILSTQQTDEEPVYTCYPDSSMDTPVLMHANDERVIYFGIYEIHIQQGKKYLRLRN